MIAHPRLAAMPSRRAQAGLSLVELMVSITLGLSGPNDTMASSRLRNSGLNSFSIACFDRCCAAF